VLASACGDRGASGNGSREKRANGKGGMREVRVWGVGWLDWTVGYF
jgi:hypothetical protein